MSTLTETPAAGAHEEHAEHPAFLQHHFHTVGQQQSASKFGMWLFIAQEILFFGGLFMAYATFRYLYPETWLAAHEYLSVPMGSINTLVLITSSLTMALAVRAAQIGNQSSLRINLIITIVLACCFLVVKYFEYSHKIHDCLLPGNYYGLPVHDAAGNLKLDAAGERIYADHCTIARSGEIPGKPAIFFAIYFVMTGMHGLHVLLGVGVLLWMYFRARKMEFGPQYYTPVENVGLYWHLVDIIWIFLFPLLYLVK